MGNLFKGKTYEGTSFIIDKIYRCKTEMDAEAAEDGVFVGRYVLVAYSDEALSQDKRNQLEAAINSGGSVPSEDDLNTSEKQYKYYFNKDGKISHDRKVFRKKYYNNTWMYEEIAFLNSSLSDESINAIIQNKLTLIKQDNDAIRLDLEGTSLGSVNIATIIEDNLKFKYDNTAHKLNLFIGTETTPFASVDATDFIKDSFLQNVEYDTTTNTLIFTFITQNGTQTIGPINIDIMNAGNGIKIDGNDIAIKLDTTSSDRENFLSLSSNGLKISGIQQAIENYIDSSIVWTEKL